MWFIEDEGLAGRILIPFRHESEARAYAAQRYPRYCQVICKEAE